MEFPNNEMFTFAVARIRAKETSLLSDQALTNLLACRTYEECFQSLVDKGWGPANDTSIEELLTTESEKTWSLMRELFDEKQMCAFDIFRYVSDFHNLKAAITEAYIRKEVPNVYKKNGTVPVETIRKCAAENEFAKLPDYLEVCGREAREVLFQSGDPQLCDIIIDRASLKMTYDVGNESGNELLAKYAELKCAAANINIAVRACRTKKDNTFLERAFVPCKSLNIQTLISAARNGEESIYEYLEKTDYSDAVPALKAGGAAFDKWCDDRMIKLIKPEKYNAFTISPVIAYMIARENEIKSVRIILSGKANELPEEKIKERVRISYV
jgi:V/A-type H+-transporting ATPase subunit C